MIRLKNNHVESIKKIAQETYPHECCGIMVGQVEGDVKSVNELIPAINERTDSLANRYLITAEFVQNIETRLRNTDSNIVGFFHSHPDVPARPSTYDRDHAWPWYSYLIVSVVKGQAVEVLNWKLQDDRTAFDPETIDVV
ncbi:MAG: M67 family metallopeptidase [Acidobacteriota bacterium]